MLKTVWNLVVRRNTVFSLGTSRHRCVDTQYEVHATVRERCTLGHHANYNCNLISCHVIICWLINNNGRLVRLRFVGVWKSPKDKIGKFRSPSGNTKQFLRRCDRKMLIFNSSTRTNRFRSDYLFEFSHFTNSGNTWPSMILTKIVKQACTVYTHKYS